ncbi:UNVERIFIED_CONTAM: 40S ribosomal protein S3-2 [Sesamum calycinum]|uniref:40S ribosomal protein S3-2 n=1 Tax=Sesamum calycinum TaxID=2727403 RepID=A0AAW2NSB6_9LAMI
MATQMSKKRKFVADGVFFAELNELLMRELAEDGYSGVEVRVTPMRTEIIIRATRTQNVLGEKGRRIRELTSVVQKRFKFPENSVELYAEKVNNRGLCAIAQAESLRYKLLGGLAVRRACYGVLRFVMESGAKGCEVIVSGKLRAQRAKSMKFKDGYMISSGQPVKEYIDSAVRHVLLRQGVLGIKVKIMLDWDPKGKQGPTTPLPDLVTIHPPKEEEFIRPSMVPAEVEQAMPVNLTANAISAINGGDVNSKPLVQVLDIKLIGSTQERYRLLLSDSVATQHAMLATQLNDRVKTGGVRKGSVIQLIDYICSTVQNRKIDVELRLAGLVLGACGVVINSAYCYEFELESFAKLYSMLLNATEQILG